jgi:hypothetical protein
MPSNWEEIVDLQDETLRWYMSGPGQRYAAMFGQSMVANLMNDPAVIKEAETAGWDPNEAVNDTHWLRGLAELEAKKLMMAEPIYVNQEVKQLIEAAAPTFEPEVLRVEDVFPTLYGFMVFPEAFIVSDGRGKKIAFRALCWGPIDKEHNQLPQTMRGISPQDAGGIFLTVYSHKDDFPLEDYPITEGDLGGTRVPSLTLSHVSPWHFDQKLPIDVNLSGLSEVLKIAQVAWRLARQTITTPVERQLPKHFRKRAVRSGLSSDVTLIRLRHLAPRANGEPGEVEWQHRWIVRGHWHTYHYKDGTTRQLYLAPYVKGPDDKPLKVTELRAFELVR